mmetsp:Transcript_16496/g.26800  ORF Transcript_16496/g.26800 Transcript_16496/m.26800 type:complete len:243 (-) Transcript_16496:43-771(-)|eukprot:CAMPEP_0203787928 /NCGR_PEP_ID=MMETSP0100_2-20121128/2530_1 /ASSEMBLY_ACC=CAM_ASM_000210 /TAXON_ID=96639 /ORGANISM=" , Strain NY0313808BC1" /LENGTH=242 /DNA_ID=CAMNT_0050690547 /DNA_START=117 /DNA_END=845 /DNA_ORIENTATION=-
MAEASVGLAVLVVLLALAWGLVKRRQSLRGNFRNKVLLVIAHPDDESMFFVPTIRNFLRENVHVLCLSSGNADGLGRVREKEMVACCSGVLGIPAANVSVLNHEKLEDGMQNEWDTGVIAGLVREAVQGLESLDTVLTFDEFGVSSHPNHISTFNGVKRFKEENLEYLNGRGVKCLKLKTVNIVRKYSSVLDIFFSRGELYVNPSLVLVVQAMAAHASQFVWFRKLSVAFSRYTFINTLVEI